MLCLLFNIFGFVLCVLSWCTCFSRCLLGCRPDLPYSTSSEPQSERRFGRRQGTCIDRLAWQRPTCGLTQCSDACSGIKSGLCFDTPSIIKVGRSSGLCSDVLVGACSDIPSCLTSDAAYGPTLVLVCACNPLYFLASYPANTLAWKQMFDMSLWWSLKLKSLSLWRLSYVLLLASSSFFLFVLLLLLSSWWWWLLLFGTSFFFVTQCLFQHWLCWLSWVGRSEVFLALRLLKSTMRHGF